MKLCFGSQEFDCTNPSEAQMYLDKIIGFIQSELGFRAFDDNGVEMSIDLILRTGGLQ